MKIGTIKEVKDNENRVGLTPAGVKKLLKDNALKKSEEECVVFVQKGCGVGAGFKDDEYERAGAQVLDSAAEVVKAVDLLVKVKEPVPAEYALLDQFKDKTLFTYLHLSGVDKALTEKLLANRITAIAYETVENDQGELPLLAPMSEVAGVLAVQYGAQFLQKKYHGIGVTLGKIDGADSAEIVVIGAGFVGATAARTAAGMGGNVTVLNRSKERLEVLKKDFRRYLGERLFANVSFLELNEKTLPEAVRKADLLIGAVLIPGARAPIIVKEPIVREMKKGAVIVDVSIDQGGCIWGSKPTTHSDPVYELDGKIYCCITNMPGQVARQSTQALTHATIPYIKILSEYGVKEAIKASIQGKLKVETDPDKSFTDEGGLAKGVNTYKGKITYKSVAIDLGLGSQFAELNELIGK